ncbi:MAG: imidazolonepropionase [Candidatus Nanopelagicaceae bacterium]|nr:imidazolonepropionase [Candidatus Nanopelagicaceae bacterium]
MSDLLVTDIGCLVTNDPAFDGSPLGLIQDAAFAVTDGKVSWVGAKSAIKAADFENVISANGKAVIPGFVDSHNHLIFSGDRAAEFSARMQGQPYSAGGINYTVGQTRKASDQELRANAAALVIEGITSGSTTVEIKSGYGLTIADEVRSLKIAREFTEEVTFLGAHVVPAEFKSAPDDYVAMVCGPMLDAVAPIAKWIDVFCDRGAFTPDQTRQILSAGIAKGLLPRLHANQLEPGEGVQVGVELGAASVDHISHYSNSDISLLAGANTVATFLPGAEFSTRNKYPDARPLLDAGVKVAIASDCNPGSSYTTSMPLMIALAVREMFFSPEQALWSATKGGALALRRNDVGHLSVGANADFAILSSQSHLHLAYRPGVNLIEQVWRNGNQIS